MALKNGRPEIDIVSVAYKTVDVFSGITGRRLFLKDGKGVPHTDGYTISVPFDSKRFYNVVEHELSHVLFKSDGKLKAEFVSQYAAIINNAALSQGVGIPRGDLVRLLNLMVGLLEDHRVSSLWGDMYPGSYKIFREGNVEIIKGAKINPQESIVSLFFYVESGLPTGDGPLSIHIPAMVKALGMVNGNGPISTLIAIKWLVTTLIDNIIHELNQNSGDKKARSEAAKKLVNTPKTPASLQERVSDVEPLEGETPDPSSVKDLREKSSLCLAPILVRRIPTSLSG